jgi:hypothetical protein
MENLLCLIKLYVSLGDMEKKYVNYRSIEKVNSDEYGYDDKNIK